MTPTDTALDRTRPDTAARARGRRTPVRRIVRLHLLDRTTFIWIPLIIVGSALVVSLIVAGIILAVGTPPEDLREGMRHSWAVLSPMWYFFALAVMAVSTTLQFALGLGSTRRDYWLGTQVTFVGFAAVVAAVFAGLRGIELATDGWGVSVVMFDALWDRNAAWWVGAWSTFALGLAMLNVGAAAAACYMRWRAMGVVVLALGVSAVLLAGAAVVTVAGAWSDVVRFALGLGPVQVFGVVFAIAVLAGIAGFVIVRRATPR